MNQWTAALLKTGSEPGKIKYALEYGRKLLLCLFQYGTLFSGDASGRRGTRGIFAFGFSTVGQQMFLLAYFGIRPFHITDGTVQYRFGDYLHHRYLTCTAAMLLGLLRLTVSGYRAEKAAIIFLLIGYKVIDGFADVYESEFQRNGRLYLTGKSNTFRTILSVGVFLITLTVGKNLAVACVAAVCGQAVGVYLFDVIVLRCLEGVDYSRRKGSLRELTMSTILLFVSVFLDFYIFSASKYAIDAHMNDAASGYFNVIFYADLSDQSGGRLCDSAVSDQPDRLLEQPEIFRVYAEASAADGSHRSALHSCGRGNFDSGPSSAVCTGMDSGASVCRKADALFGGICSDCAGRRLLCAFKSLLLRFGNHAPAENDFGNLCGYDRGGGCSGAGGGHPKRNFRRGFFVSDFNGVYGSGLCPLDPDWPASGKARCGA